MNPFGLLGGETYKLPTIKQPSWFNIEGGIGLFGGMLAGITAMTVASPAVLAYAAGGALLGGVFGKVRMERERKQGRTIHEPSLLNKTWIAGTLVGLCAAAVLVPIFFAGLPLLGSIATVSLIAGGSLIGSFSEYFKQSEDFSRARERHELDRMREVEKSLNMKKAPDKVLAPEPELPEFQNKPKWSDRFTKPAAKEPATQPNFRSKVEAPEAEKGFIR